MYGDIHRYLLRSVASRGVLSITEANSALQSYTGTEVENDIGELVKEINGKIRPFQQTIKSVIDELTNEELLVFISLGADEVAKVQNVFSAAELEFFRLLIEEIMTAENRRLTAIQAVNVVGKMQGSFTKSAAEKLLKTWCRMRYLDKSNTNYALGVRAIHEFESYFRETVPDAVEECGLCKQIVYRGFNCPACQQAVHTRCLNMYLEKVVKWPCCKTDYDSSQLDMSGNDRLPSQRQDTFEESSERNTFGTPAFASQETIAEDIDLTQNTATEISQCVTRKRKRQRE